MIRYSDIAGSSKQLNEVVFAGSHDAGIGGAGIAGNAKTQSLSISKQAKAGVRFFDLRIAAFSTGNQSYGAKQTELRAFHADGAFHSHETKTRAVAGFAGTHQIERSKVKAGTDEGFGLHAMLRDAKKFVESATYSSEFLVLKFDKCTNWQLIADMCRNVLGTAIYSAGGNLNTKKLSELAGKVICAFMPDGYAELPLGAARVGITPIINLYKPAANYNAGTPGIQYWGAGGTNPFSPFGKRNQNIKNQGKIFEKATTGVQVKKKFQFLRSVEYSNAPANPNILGMMYWTTTGLLENISNRNDNMWNLKNVGGMDKMWLKAFSQYSDYLGNVVPPNIDQMSYGSGNLLKLFMPNIVMVDFADEQKCGYISGLNTIASNKLVDITNRLYDMSI